MKIYTRTGDEGETGLFGGGRVPKQHLRIHAYGEVDELNCLLAWCADEATMQFQIRLRREMRHLFALGAHLATPPEAGKRARGQLPEWRPELVKTLESEIDQWDAELPPLKNFILPGGTELSARLHLARAICRRVERTLCALHADEPVEPALRAYVNRLSDWLFVHARAANYKSGVDDVIWKPEEAD